MGGHTSQLEFDPLSLDDPEEHGQNRNLSKKYNISEWDTLPPKNYLYYANKRFFKVPNSFYEREASENWEFWFWVW